MSADPIEAFIGRQAPAVQPIIRRLRALVRASLPDLHEYLDAYGVIRYGRGTTMRERTYYICGHKAHANLGFARGASLPDPDGLIEGTGKNLRHVKLKSVAAAEHSGLARLLRAAGKLDA